MMVFTSAKSRLIRPGHENQIRDALDRLPQHSSAVANASVSGVVRSMIVSSRSLGIVMIVSTHSRSASRPALGLQLPLLALELERLGHDGDGQRAELAREAGDDRRGAGARAAAEARSSRRPCRRRRAPG